jgi:UDP-3-O-[3-hydroxymyristoyl] glucosamine N-acyltransferase
MNGTPAIPYMLERRLVILHQRLPDLFRRVEALEKKPE